jgi:hypothetical protein
MPLMMDRPSIDALPGLPVRARGRHPVAVALVPLLACGLAPIAMAHPSGPPHPHIAATALPARPGNEPPDRSPGRAAPASLQSERSDVGPHPDDRLVLTSELVTTTTPPGGNAPDGAPRPLDAPFAPAPLTAAAMGAGYVDPAGGHPLVRPIETSNPYRGR